MGSEVKATCKCGFNKKFLIGGGMRNFTTTEYFPCYCDKCNDIVQGNLKAEVLSCPSCNSSKASPYNNKIFLGKTGNNVVAKSFDNELYNGTYRCPHCRNMSLQFINTGLLWD